jgi:hypothetical protein
VRHCSLNVHSSSAFTVVLSYFGQQFLVQLPETYLQHWTSMLLGFMLQKAEKAPGHMGQVWNVAIC